MEKVETVLAEEMKLEFQKPVSTLPHGRVVNLFSGPNRRRASWQSVALINLSSCLQL